MAKKKSVGKLIAVQFIRSFLIVVAMLATGIASYRLTMTYYEVTGSGDEEGNVLDIVRDVTADDVSRNIIYSVNDEDKKVKAMVIEVLNTNTGNLDYITIPADTQISMGTELYKRICGSGIDAPQIINLSDINSYFKEGASYEYGILMLEDYLGIDLGYYTCMEQSVFDTCFTGAGDSGMYKLNDSIIQEASGFAAEGNMDSYIKSWGEKMTSDLKIKNRLKYSESYSRVNPEYIYYHMMKGNSLGGVFSPDIEGCKSMYQMVLLDKEHTARQSDVPDISSNGLNIKVLNGSGGTNIAAAAKNILAEDGFNVVKIADNPDVIENTVIYVTKEGMGRDLLVYFTNASIEVKELDAGIDIAVVVGKSDVGIGSR